MTKLTTLFVGTGLSAGLFLTGCKPETETTPPKSTGGAKAPGSGMGAPEQHDDHAHVGETVDVTMTFGDTVLTVTAPIEIPADTELHIDIGLKSGPAPAAIRTWVGDEAATGALKSKADGHGDHWHAHAESPAEIAADTMIWVEIETDDGTRTAKSVDA